MEIEILDFIQQMRTAFGDFIMPIITHLGDAGIMWIALTLVMIIIPKTRRVGITMAVALAINALICNCALKPLVARTRPFDINTDIQLLIKKPTDYSFPSGHTSASFAVTTVLLKSKYKKIAWTALVLSILIAFSRMYLYVHYPTDILGGLAVGVLSAIAGMLIMKKIYARIDSKKAQI